MFKYWFSSLFIVLLLLWISYTEFEEFYWMVISVLNRRYMIIALGGFAILTFTTIVYIIQQIFLGDFLEAERLVSSYSNPIGDYGRRKIQTHYTCSSASIFGT